MSEGGCKVMKQTSATNSYKIPKTMNAWVLGGPNEMKLIEKKRTAILKDEITTDQAVEDLIHFSKQHKLKGEE